MTSGRKIVLQENHRRSLTSTLLIVEKLLADLEDSILNPSDRCCFEVSNDVDAETLIQNLKLIKEARKQCCILKEKYDLDKTFQSLQRLIDAKKTKIWEVLHNSKSRRMKGFGEFPKEIIKEYDGDIDDLMSITDKIKF